MTTLKEHYFTWALALFVFLLPWQTRLIFGFSSLGSEVSEYGVMSVYVTEALLILALLVGYLSFGTPKMRRAYESPALRAGIIMGVALISTVISSVLALSLAELLHFGSALLFFIALLDARVQIKPVIMGFAGGLILPFLVGLFQVFLGFSPAVTLLGLASRDAVRLGDAVVVLGDGTRVLRAYGSFPHPNVFGGYLAVGALCAAWLARRLPDYRSGAGLLVVSVLGLLLTGSRSAALGLALGTGLAFLVTRMKETAVARIAVIPIAVAVIGGALGMTLFAPGLGAATRGGGTVELQSLEERRAQYGDFWGMMRNSGVPEMIFGHGFHSYVFSLHEAFPGRDVWDYQPVHNVPLLLFWEIGLLGGIAVIFWASAIDRMNFARFPNRDAVAAFAMGNVILVILFFDHYLWSSWAGLALVAFVMALTVRMGEAEER